MYPRHGCQVLTALVIAAALGCSANQRPELLPLSPQVAYVGSRLDVVLRAFDPDADRLVYSFDLAGLEPGERAKLATMADEAVFSWVPIGSEVGVHQADFTVSDGHATDLESTTITVKPAADADTAPRFVRPLNNGTVLDLGKQKCLQLDVAVEDPDTLTVRIRQNPAILGSQLASTGPRAAQFSWCPTTQQATARQTYVLVLEADDGDHPPVRKEYTIVLTGVPGVTSDGGVKRDAGGPPPVLTAPFKLDFERESGGLTGTGDWRWGKLAFVAGATCAPATTPPKSGASGSGVWGTVLNDCYTARSNNADPCDNKDTADDSVLTLTFKVPASLAKPQLSYQEWNDFMLPYDWAEVRVNSKVVAQQCKGSYVTPTAWVKRTIDLGAVGGQTVVVTFHFMSSGVVNLSGWYLDDVAVGVN